MDCNAKGGMDTGWGCPSETSSSLAECAFADMGGDRSNHKESFIGKGEEQPQTSRFF